MARLPIPGQDNGTWGDILNEYLSQSLKPDGHIQDNVVTAAALAPNSVTGNAIAPNTITATEIASDTITAAVIADGSITETLLHADVQAKLNATAGAPDWDDITNKPTVIAAGADAAAARAAISAGTSNLAIGTTSTTAKAGDYAPTQADVGLSNVDNTSDANKPISSATQTALDAKAATIHAHTATQISDSTSVGRSVVTATDATAARTAIGAGTSSLVIGTTSTTAKAGDYTPTKSDVGLGNVDNTSDAVKNSASATLTNKTIAYANNTLSGLPYDLSMIGFGQSTPRAASSYGNNPFGIKLQRACTLTSVTFRCNTADASGNLVCELRKNGTTLSGSSTTIAAAGQVAGGTSTGSWSCVAGDIITIYVTAVGTTPGNGLAADIMGTC